MDFGTVEQFRRATTQLTIDNASTLYCPVHLFTEAPFSLSTTKVKLLPASTLMSGYAPTSHSPGTATPSVGFSVHEEGVSHPQVPCCCSDCGVAVAVQALAHGGRGVRTQVTGPAQWRHHHHPQQRDLHRTGGSAQHGASILLHEPLTSLLVCRCACVSFCVCTHRRQSPRAATST